MIPIYLTVAFMAAISASAHILCALHMKRMIARHEAALADMRADLRIYDIVCQAGGDAAHLFVRHQQGTDSTWTDIVLSVPGLSLRMPIRPEEMEMFIADLRGQS